MSVSTLRSRLSLSLSVCSQTLKCYSMCSQITGIRAPRVRDRVRAESETLPIRFVTFFYLPSFACLSPIFQCAAWSWYHGTRTVQRCENTFTWLRTRGHPHGDHCPCRRHGACSTAARNGVTWTGSRAGESCSSRCRTSEGALVSETVLPFTVAYT